MFVIFSVYIANSYASGHTIKNVLYNQMSHKVHKISIYIKNLFIGLLETAILSKGIFI